MTGSHATLPRWASFYVRSPQLDQVRFFVDADIIAVGQSLMAVRTDVAVARFAPIKDMVPEKDEDWIPVVASQGWVTITNDKHIRTRPHEAQPALDYGLRCAHLRPPAKDPNRWDFMRLLVRHWNAIEALTDEAGPAWLAVTEQKARPLQYQPGSPPRLPPRFDR